MTVAVLSCRPGGFAIGNRCVTQGFVPTIRVVPAEWNLGGWLRLAMTGGAVKVDGTDGAPMGRDDGSRVDGTHEVSWGGWHR